MDKKNKHSKKENYLTRLKGEPNFKHFQRLTTKFGIMQHATKNIPNKKFGYCIDDNARALIVSILAYQKYQKKKFFDLENRYLNFIKFMQKPDGNFHNFLSYNLRFQDDNGSEDSFGRTVWALGFAIKNSNDQKIIKDAIKIFLSAKNHVKNLNSIRAKSFALLGLVYFYMSLKDIKTLNEIKKIADEISIIYQKNKSKNWKWFENFLTYANALIPYSLLMTFQVTKNKKYLKIGNESFDFLLDVCQENGIPTPIGYKGWYFKGKKKSIYGQQPIDPAWMVITTCKALEITKNKKYATSAMFWFSWFWGNNIIKKVMVNNKTGGIFDGIEITKVNPNQGAESTIIYLIATLILQKTYKDFQKMFKDV
jgi:uncharacterized protein YyaL (SSP411 family)